MGFSGFFRRKGIFVFANGYFKGGRSGYPGFNSGNKTFKFGVGTGFKTRGKLFGIFLAENGGKHILIENIAVTFEHQRYSVASDPVSVKLNSRGDFGC